jgi:hypothetical protein
MMTDRSWREDGYYPGLFVHIRVKDNRRVGHHWMAGRLLDGDIAMVKWHSGDCFWTYQLVHHGFKMYKAKTGPLYGEGDLCPAIELIKGSEFGAYTLGVPCKYQPGDRAFHLFMAGEQYVRLEQEFEALEEDSLSDHVQEIGRASCRERV